MLLQPVFVRDDEGNGIGTLVVIQDQLVDAGRMFDECLLDPFRTVKEIRISAGAGFIVVLLGDVMTMPGLPKKPAALNIDIDDNGNVVGLF